MGVLLMRKHDELGLGEGCWRRTDCDKMHAGSGVFGGSKDA